MADQLEGMLVNDLLTLMTLPPYAWMRWQVDHGGGYARWHAACAVTEAENKGSLLRGIIERDGFIVEHDTNHLVCCYDGCLMKGGRHG